MCAAHVTQGQNESSRRVTAGLLCALGLSATLLGSSALLHAAADSPATTTEQNVTPQRLRALVKQLTARLESAPEDLEAWRLLALAQQLLGRDADAAKAYERVLAIGGRTPDMLVLYADAVAKTAGGRMHGAPYRLVQEALRIAPNHPAALALAAQAEIEQGNSAAAADFWERMLQQIPADSPTAERVRELAAAARARAAVEAK